MCFKKIFLFSYIITFSVCSQFYCNETMKHRHDRSQSQPSNHPESEPFLIKRTLKEQVAGKIEKTAIEKAKELGIKISIAIVDESGTLQRFTRMDGARSISTRVAIKKAQTAATTQMSTRAVMERNAKTPGYPYNNFPNVILLPGGLPVMTSDGECIGGVGISGGTGDQDESCVEAGLQEW